MPFGIMVHTTGDGVPKRAHLRGQDPLECANQVYSNMKAGPHFTVDGLGQVAQYRSTREVAWHCRMRDSERRSLLDGHWKNDGNRIPSTVVDYWTQRFAAKSPAHLYPSRYPNTDYIGIEVVPCGTWIDNKWTVLWGSRGGLGNKVRHSVESYIALAALIAHLCKRHDIPVEFGSGHIVGHEDVNPYSRPGWDPGAPFGRFNWNFLETMTKGFTHLGFTDAETD